MYLKRAKAAEYLGIGETKLDELRSTGKLAYYKQGGTILLRTEDMDAYMESCRVESRTEAASRVTDLYGTYRKRRRA